jgi:hypothetical protein
VKCIPSVQKKEAIQNSHTNNSDAAAMGLDDKGTSIKMFDDLTIG